MSIEMTENFYFISYTLYNNLRVCSFVLRGQLNDLSQHENLIIEVPHTTCTCGLQS